MASSQKVQNVKEDQRGVASILVVLILMTVLGLITAAYSHLMNREVTQSLDRQLSAEAFYAAEAGVNDARDYLAHNGHDSTNCPTPSGGGSNAFVDSGQISEDNISRYTCVLVDSSPREAIYNLDEGETISFKISLGNLDNLYFGWENQSYRDPNASGPQPLSGSLGTLPREDQVPPNGTGLLRVGVYPLPPGAHGGGVITNNVLNGVSRNYFMDPIRGTGNAPGSIDYLNNALNGSFKSGNCDAFTHPALPYAQSTDRYCNTVVNNLKNIANDFYVRLTAYYAPLSVSIQASDDHDKSKKIPDLQAIIDSTGSGSDVVKRVQARVPLNKNINRLFGLQSMETICKAFRADVATPGQYGNVYNDPTTPSVPAGTCMSPFNTGTIVSGGLPPAENNPCPAPYIGTQPNCVLPAPSPTISASPNPVTSGNGTTITWDGGAPLAVSCSGSGFNTGGAVSGSAGTGAINSDTTFTVTCVNSEGTAGSASVTVSAQAPQPPNINWFQANGQSGSTTINAGDSVTLSWSASNASSCDVTDVGTGLGISGSSGVPSPSTGKVYYIDCNGAKDQVIVNVNAGGGPPPSCTAFGWSHGGGTASMNGGCSNATTTDYYAHFQYRDSLGTDCGGIDYGPQSSSSFPYSISFKFIDVSGYIIGSNPNGSTTSNTVSDSWNGGGAVC